MRIYRYSHHELMVLVITALLTALLLLFSNTAQGGQEGWYGTIVEAEYVEKYATIPVRKDVMIVDSRPTARKYDKGHIPGAVSIPDTKFDQLKHLLPEDRDTQLIFYCGGVKCPLSHKSAFKAEALGYTNIKVYAAGYPDWLSRGNLGSISTAYVKKLIDNEADVTLIDARPKKRKYDKGHIPGAISIPDRQFSELTDQLPANKDAALVFYCGGEKCTLSPKSASKAKDLGYSNVRIYTAGYPAWKQAYGDAHKSKSFAIKQGKEEGTIQILAFEQIVKEQPDKVYLVDVRDSVEFETGAFPNSVNIPIDDLEKKLATLPQDRPIVFICSTGARSGEAYDMVKMLRGDLDVYFLDAELEFFADGSYDISEPEV